MAHVFKCQVVSPYEYERTFEIKSINIYLIT